MPEQTAPSPSAMAATPTSSPWRFDSKPRNTEPKCPFGGWPPGAGPLQLSASPTAVNTSSGLQATWQSARAAATHAACPRSPMPVCALVLVVVDVRPPGVWVYGSSSAAISVTGRRATMIFGLCPGRLRRQDMISSGTTGAARRHVLVDDLPLSSAPCDGWRDRRWVCSCPCHDQSPPRPPTLDTQHRA
jgi:hypothetical protein